MKCCLTPNCGNSSQPLFVSQGNTPYNQFLISQMTEKTFLNCQPQNLVMLSVRDEL